MFNLWGGKVNKVFCVRNYRREPDLLGTCREGFFV